MNINSIIYVKLANNIYLQPGCANPPDINTNTLVDSAANVLLLANGAPAIESETQLPTKTILQIYESRMFTIETMELLLSKLPKASREAHRVPGIINNLLSVSFLCDAGCEVFFHITGCEISSNGEIIVRWWRHMQTNMWSISLLVEGVSNIIPDRSDGAMIPYLEATPINKFFPTTFMNVKPRASLYSFTMQKWGIPARPLGVNPSPQAISRDGQGLLQCVFVALSR